MPVPIHQEDGEPPYELCCFCRDPSSYWTSLLDRAPGEQVALCLHCAARADPEDVPSKRAWGRRERIAHHPTIGEISTGRDMVYPPALLLPFRSDR